MDDGRRLCGCVCVYIETECVQCRGAPANRQTNDGLGWLWPFLGAAVGQSARHRHDTRVWVWVWVYRTLDRYRRTDDRVFSNLSSSVYGC